MSEWNVWAAEVVRQLHLLKVTQKEFAKECGLSAPYLTEILRGRVPRRNPEITQGKVDEALARLSEKCTTEIDEHSHA